MIALQALLILVPCMLVAVSAVFGRPGVWWPVEGMSARPSPTAVDRLVASFGVLGIILLPTGGVLAVLLQYLPHG